MDVYGGYNYNYRIHGDCKARNITGGPPPCGLLVSRVEEIELSTEVSWILGKLVPAHLDFGETCPGCSGVNFNLLLIKSLCLSLHVHVSCMKQFSFSSSSHATCQIVYSNDQLRSSTSGRPFSPKFFADAGEVNPWWENFQGRHSSKGCSSCLHLEIPSLTSTEISWILRAASRFHVCSLSRMWNASSNSRRPPCPCRSPHPRKQRQQKNPKLCIPAAPTRAACCEMVRTLWANKRNPCRLFWRLTIWVKFEYCSCKFLRKVAGVRFFLTKRLIMHQAANKERFPAISCIFTIGVCMDCRLYFSVGSIRMVVTADLHFPTINDIRVDFRVSAPKSLTSIDKQPPLKHLDINRDRYLRTTVPSRALGSGHGID